jgi:hypothetical protein
MKLRWLLALTLGCLASQAKAEVIRTFQVAGWKASAHSGSNGEFSYCSANARYKSGITLLFTITNDLRWGVAFMHPDWRYTIGESYPVAFTIDDMNPIHDRVTAVTKTGVSMRLKGSSELFSRFRYGSRLRLATARQVFAFDLTGTSEMLRVLLECAKHNGRPASPPMVSNPFAPPPPSAKQAKAPVHVNRPEVKVDPTLRAEATAFAANLLSAANVTGYRFLTPDELPKIKGDARWIVPGEEIGLVSVRPGLNKDQQMALGGDLISEDARRCEGKFASGSMPDDEKGMARAFTLCDFGDVTVSMYYFTIPRPKGGAYVIATGSMGDALTASEAKRKHESFRDAAFKVVLK